MDTDRQEEGQVLKGRTLVGCGHRSLDRRPRASGGTGASSPAPAGRAHPVDTLAADGACRALRDISAVPGRPAHSALRQELGAWQASPAFFLPGQD